MTTKYVEEICKNGQLMLDYYCGLVSPFRKEPVSAPIYAINPDDTDIRFVALSKKNEIINTIDNTKIPFPVKIYPYIVPFEDSYVALNKNNKEIVNLDGKVVASFRESVEPQILLLNDGSFVALEKGSRNQSEQTRIISTSKIKYRSFSQGVWETLVPGQEEGQFYALMDDFHTVLNNLFDDTKSKYGSLPRFRDNNAGGIASDLGRIIRIGNVFVTLTDDNKIAGTDNIIYGEFSEEADPESLVFVNNSFYAIITKRVSGTDYTTGKYVEEISYRKRNSEKYENLGEVPRTVIIETQKLEKILSEKK
jgi:hypothetical protein